MKKINCKSDFDFILHLRNANGDEIGFPDYDWKATLSTGRRLNIFTASCIGGVCTNCFNDNGQIRIVADNHRLGPGTLNVEFQALLPNESYPDGSRSFVIVEDTDIELMQCSSEAPSETELELLLPYIRGEKGEKGDSGAKGDKGEPFTFADFTPAQIAQLQAPAQSAATTAYSAAMAADNAAQAANEALSTINGKQERLTDSEDITVEGTKLSLTDKAAKRLFVDIWNTLCGKYGKHDPDGAPDQEHPFLLNGIYLTYKEALDCLRYFRRDYDQTEAYANSGCRTHIPVPTEWNGTYSRFAQNAKNLEVAFLPYVISGSISQAFYGCARLKTCTLSCATLTSTDLAFYNCSALVNLKFKGLRNSISLSHSPAISAESINYLITNRGGTNAITVTVHPDVYSKLSDATNSEWFALTEAASLKNIQFATI